MKSTNKRFMTAFLALFLITAMTAAIVSGVYAGYFTSDSATVTAVYVKDATINLGLSGDNSNVLVPGKNIPLTNAPTVVIGKDTSACYVFIKITESANFDTFMWYYIADGWTALDGVDGVYYRVNEAKVTEEQGISFDVIKDNLIHVYANTTRDVIATANESLTVNAYAVQKSGETPTAADAWAQLGIQ